MAMNEPADLESCFREGVLAREERRPLADNPYDVRTPEHREWAAGWSATLDLDEDDDPESTRIKPGRTDKDAEPDNESAGRGPLSG